MRITLKGVISLLCTNAKVYMNGDLVYSPFNGKLAPFLEREVLWIDAEDDIIKIGISDK